MNNLCEKKETVADEQFISNKQKADKLIRQHLKNNPCSVCGYDEIFALHFDWNNYNLVPSINEITSRPVLCASCHQRDQSRQYCYKCGDKPVDNVLCANCACLKMVIRTSPSVYVASSLHNADHVQKICDLFELNGTPITYKWYKHGQLFDEKMLTKVGELEERGVYDCDLFFMIHPARHGTHCELGMARVLNKHIIILENDQPIEQKTFYYRPAGHPRPINRFQNESEAIAHAFKLLRG